MADLSFMHEASLLGLVDAATVEKRKSKKRRRYIGMSSIGDPCNRKIWLGLNAEWTPRLSAKMVRIFETGDILEKRLIKDLKLAGFEITGRQKTISLFRGKFRGHCDGIISGIPESSEPHVLEIKTANASNFREFAKNGVAEHKTYGAKYAAQMQSYMGSLGFERGLWIVENKDTSERYMERVKYDKEAYRAILIKVETVINCGKTPPKGISLNETFFPCRSCEFNNADFCRKVWPGESPF